MDGGNHVVGGLAEVHVVVGMDQAGTEVAAENLGGAVGDDFVGVGVGGSAGAGLEDVQDEMLIVPAVGDFLGGLDDGVAYRRVQYAQVHVGLGASQLDEAEGADELARKTEVADGEIEHGPHGGRAVQRIGGNLHFAHGVAFDTGVGAGHVLLPSSK